MSNALYDLIAGFSADSGDTLLVAHGGEPQQYLSLASHIWMRTAGTAINPQAWYRSDRKFAAIFLPLPKGRASLDFCLACVTPLLEPDGKLYLFGANDAGIKSAEKNLAGYFADIEVAAVGGKGRVYAATAALQKPPVDLEDLATPMQMTSGTEAIGFMNYPGLFAKGQLDAATKLLIDCLPPVVPDAHVLDYACGLGVVGRAVQLRRSSIRLLLADYDPLAVHAAQQNVPGAEAVCTASPESIDGRFDLIVSNPPIHLGQALDYGIVQRLVAWLPTLLAGEGSAYLVTQITVPVARYAAESKLAAMEVAASSGFRVTKISRA